ncbi:FAD-dependent oxidoreductase [Cognatilysobacter lacus]|uniref:FAD-dependent monooxygenase n=1 Tax=Cognatilysobacter lacus TaxID=1643323 RepID=A0A5D8ZCG3_9GAMM|nr:NAD(P)/FAD-dependent oxidoreductase [Lysobacter lacus]TZF90354.1 FAD-dependent monooxygenase [Lysobacter lacus]
MAGALRIAVIGYGTGGQAAAVLLSRDGHRVEVFERAPAPGPVGAGFLLQPVGQSVLWELGLLAQALHHGRRIASLYGETPAGRPVMDMRYADLDARLFGLGLQRGALFELLDAAWTTHRCLHAGVDIVDLDPASGTLTAADGRRFAGFDLVIVADGAASRMRTRVAKATLDRPYPWGAQWCLAPARGWAHADVLHQRYVGARRMVGVLPVGTRPGDAVAKLSFFWSLPAAALDRTDVPSREWREDVARVWPEALETLADIDAPAALAGARYRDTVHREWHAGRAVLLGDAAHAMSPQLGQGVNMALLDALVLRDALRKRESIESSLSHYAAQRRAHLRAYHFWSRALTPLFQSERDGWARVRDLTFHPLSRLPVARGQMLRVLSGTRRGWWSTMRLEPGFLEALERSAPDSQAHAVAAG